MGVLWGPGAGVSNPWVFVLKTHGFVGGPLGGLGACWGGSRAVLGCFGVALGLLGVWVGFTCFLPGSMCFPMLCRWGSLGFWGVLCGSLEDMALTGSEAVLTGPCLFPLVAEAKGPKVAMLV